MTPPLRLSRRESVQRFVAERCPHCDGDGVVQRGNGDYLRAKREEYGISLRRVAAHVGISAAYLSDIERGRRYADRQFGAIERAIHTLKGAI